MPAPSAPLRQPFRAELATSGYGDTLSTLPSSSLFLYVNGAGLSVPMSSEPPAVASLRAAAELIFATGGLAAKRIPSSGLVVRIGLEGCGDTPRVRRRLAALAGDLLQIGVDALDDQGFPACCMPRLRVHDAGERRVDVDLYVERGEARGQAFLEKAARAMLPTLMRLAECQATATLQLFSTPVDQLSVSGRVDLDELIDAVMRAGGAPDRSAAPPACVDEQMERFCAGRHQPELAARHNDHVLAEISAAFRGDLHASRLAREARAHAARWGSCEPLAYWRQHERELIGQLQLPLLFDSRDVDARTAARLARTTIRGQAESDHLAHDSLVEIASVALAASLGFLHHELLTLLRARPRHTLLPPPLPERRQIRQRPAADAEKRLSESGVRPALRDGRGLRARTGSEPD